jgi:protein TonB
LASRTLFDDVLLETSSGERRRRKLALFATLAGEAIAVVIALPLLYLDAVPGYTVHAQPLTTPPRPVAPIQLTSGPSHPGGPSVALARSTDEYVVARTIADPHLTYDRYRVASDDTTTDPRLVTPDACCSNSTFSAIAGGPPRAVVPAPPPRPVISHVEEGMILRRVEPAYPRIARDTRTQGVVVLRAVISKEGRIEGLQVVSGHPLLVSAATDAVAQWRFRPYLLNGTPVEVEAQITVRFVLGGS